jgi:hypothetical protein
MPEIIMLINGCHLYSKTLRYLVLWYSFVGRIYWTKTKGLTSTPAQKHVCAVKKKKVEGSYLVYYIARKGIKDKDEGK